MTRTRLLVLIDDKPVNASSANIIRWPSETATSTRCCGARRTWRSHVVPSQSGPDRSSKVRRGMSGEPTRLAANTIRRTIFDQVHNVTGSPCCGATPAGTTPRAPLNVAPCRRYSDNSPVGTEYGTARSQRSTLRASVVSWLHCSSQPSTHVPHQKIGKNRNRADLQSANPLAGGSSPAAPLPSQSCSPAQPRVSASRRRPNSRPGRPVRAELQRRCVLAAQR